MDIDKLIQGSRDEVIRLRRDFHQHPELGLAEHRTSGRVADYLEALGMDVARVHGTGVVGLLKGAGPGPTLMLRADLDALPIQEETKVDYRSVNEGVMHACGHDAHTAILLVAAKILSTLREGLAGQVKFVFQPNEENVGALAMIKEGVLEAPRVEACLGLHVWTPLSTGKIGISSGPVMAGMEHFQLTIKGKGGHTATPQSAVDPILAAAGIIQGVQMIQTRELDALNEPTVIMFGQVQGGTASNIIPDQVSLAGTMRYLFEGQEESQESPKNRFQRAVADICRTHRAGFELEFNFGHPTLVNDPGLAGLVRSVAAQELTSKPEVAPLVSLAGEDFSEFTARVPGAFYFLGAGNEAKGAGFPHHHPCFNIDEEALILGVEMQVRTCLAYFRQAARTGPEEEGPKI